MKHDYQTYRSLSSMSGISLKTVHGWCSLPKVKKHKGSELLKLRKQEFEQFLLQDSISYCHPSKKYAGKKFLRDMMEITRQKYLQQRQYHQYGIVSMSTMKAFRPSYILLFRDTPLDQCLCDKCENVEQLLKTLQALGMNVPPNRYATIDSVVCVD